MTVKVLEDTVLENIEKKVNEFTKGRNVQDVKLTTSDDKYIAMVLYSESEYY